MADETANVQVCIRFRPLLPGEDEKYLSGDWRPSGEYKLDCKPDGKGIDISCGKKIAETKFNFDHVMPPGSSQELVYEHCGSRVVSDVLEGYNGTIFAYGQTGSGKTHTMLGDRSSAVDMGVIPRAAQAIFEYIRTDMSGSEYTLVVSFLEIYREKIRDLLDPSKQNLSVRETPKKGIYVEGISEEYVTTEQDIFDLLELGQQARAIASTRMNDVSSRSHSVFTLTVHQKDAEDCTKSGKLNLVDLAGSEKVGKTGAEGQTLEEAKKINQSLSALGNCIAALVDSSRTHVPYRDSKLTRILQESLGGNTKTTLIIAASPHEYNAEETLSSLRFGQRAKRIKTHVHINKMMSPEQLMALVQALRDELNAVKKRCAILERELRKRGCDPDRDIQGLHDADGSGDPDDPDNLSTLTAAELRVRLGDAKAQFACRVDELETEISEVREQLEESQRCVREHEERKAAADMLARKARTRSSTVEARAEQELRQAKHQLKKQEEDLTMAVEKCVELEARQEALMEVAEAQEADILANAEERDEALSMLAEAKLSLESAEAAKAQLESQLKERTELHTAEITREKEALAASQAARAEIEAQLAEEVAKHRGARSEVEKLTSDLSDARAAAEQKSADLAASESSLEQLRSQHADLKAQLAKAQSASDTQREESTKAHAELRAQLQAERSKLAESESTVASVKEDLARVNTDLSETKTELATTRENLAAKETEAGNLAAKVSEAETSLAAEISKSGALGAEIAHLKREIQGKEASLREEGSGHEEREKQLLAQVREAESQCLAKGEEIAREKRRAADAEAEIEKQKAEIAKGKSEIAERSAKAEALQSELEQARAEGKAAQARASQAENEAVSLKETIAAGEVERDSLKQQLEMERTSRADAEKRIEDESQRHEKALETVRAATAAERERAAEELSKARSEASAARAERDTLGTELESLRSKHAALELTAATTVSQVDSLTADVARLTSERASLESSHAEQLRAVEEARRSLQQELKESRAKSTDVEGQLRKLQQQSDTLKSTAQLERSRASAMERIAEEEKARARDLDDRVMDSDRRIAEAEGKLEDARSELALRLRQAEEEKASLREKVRRLERMLANYKDAAKIRAPVTRSVEESSLLEAFRARLAHDKLKDDLHEIDSPAKREIVELRKKFGGAGAPPADGEGSAGETAGEGKTEE